MLLNAEIKDEGYADLPRQQQAQYAQPTQTYLKADASTGKNYIDLNAAAKTYNGAWLFGQEHVECYVGRLKAQWLQWCPVPAGIADGVLLRGNVIYQNADKTYTMSSDQYEGVLRTEGHERIFIGKTQHTFHGSNLPNGSMRVVADLRINLNERLAYNPMVSLPSQQIAQRPNSYQSAPYGQYGQQGYGSEQQASYGAPQSYGSGYSTQNQQPASNYNAGYGGGGQAPDSGF